MRKSFFIILSLFCFLHPHQAQAQKTYCNPINIDYGYTPIPDFSEGGKHRATTDPAFFTTADIIYSSELRALNSADMPVQLLINFITALWFTMQMNTG